MGKPTQPQTARQLAAAANRAKKVERADDSEEDSGEDGGLLITLISAYTDGGAGGRDALGLDMGKGSREGSHIGGRGTPTISSGVGGNGNGRSARARTGTKRHRADEDEEDESDGEEDERPAIKRSGTSGNGQKKAAHAYVDPPIGEDLGGFEPEADEPIYCLCRAHGYGEMIGCDDEACEYEWVSSNLCVKVAGWLT
jgi:inhibitor of growth protein 3